MSVIGDGAPWSEATLEAPATLCDVQTVIASAMPTVDRDARLRSVMAAHFDFIWRIFRRVGLADSADDGAQRVFLAFASRLADVPPEREKAFLYATALRVASDLRRAAPRRRELPTDPLGGVFEGEAAGLLAAQDQSPEALVEQRKARALLERVLAELKPDLREVFVLYEMEELSTQEIADMMTIPQGTVKSRLRLARAEFEEKLSALRGKS